MKEKFAIIGLMIILLLAACAQQHTSTPMVKIENTHDAPTTLPPESQNGNGVTPTPSPTALPPTVSVPPMATAQETFLFVPTKTQVDAFFADDPTVMRFSFVYINFAVLGGETGPPFDGSGAGQRITLNLFDDTEFIALLERVEANPTGGFTWIGHLEGLENSFVTFVVNEGVVIGKITTSQEIYELRFAEEELHVVVQINQAAFPSEGEPIPVPVEEP